MISEIISHENHRWPGKVACPDHGVEILGIENPWNINEIYPHPTFPWKTQQFSSLKDETWIPLRLLLQLLGSALPRHHALRFLHGNQRWIEMAWKWHGNGTSDSDSLNLKNHVHHVDTKKSSMLRFRWFWPWLKSMQPLAFPSSVEFPPPAAETDQFGGNLKVLCDEKITHHRMVIIHKKPSPGNRLTQKRHCEILGLLSQK